MKGGTLDVVDGKAQVVKKMTWETGKAYWLDADASGQQHGDINRGSAPVEVIVVEMRSSASLTIAWIVVALLALRITANLGWRLASRRWSLPCPTAFAGVLENRRLQRILGTAKTLDRIGVRPGQRVLEIGPGPGRLLIPVGVRILPGGEVIGIDMQQGMLDRLARRAPGEGPDQPDDHSRRCDRAARAGGEL